MLCMRNDILKCFANELNSKFYLIAVYVCCYSFFRLSVRITVPFQSRYIPWASLSEVLIYLTPKIWWCIAYDDSITMRKICIEFLHPLTLSISLTHCAMHKPLSIHFSWVQFYCCPLHFIGAQNVFPCKFSLKTFSIWWPQYYTGAKAPNQPAWVCVCAFGLDCGTISCLKN